METHQAIVNIPALRFAGLVLVMACLAGCKSTPPIYSWGRYEDQLYLTYSKPDKAAPEAQLLKLEEDLQKARSANKPLPPGFHAYRGYLYHQVGKSDQARAEFEAEKSQFPESAVLMDRLISRLKVTP